MTITAHTPQWSNAAHTAVDLIVQFPWIEGEVPFTAHVNDSESYSIDLYNLAIADDFGSIADYVAPPIRIPSVSPRQIRQALTRVGLRQAVEAAVAAGDQDTKDWWEFSTVFERNNPVVLAMGIALSVSEAQLDSLWLLAGTL